MKIDVCSKKEQDYIIERLVEYNLSQVEAKQKENFIDLSKKIGKDDKIVAGIVARMYCWNVVYVDTLWVDSSYRGKKLGSLLLEEVENDAKSAALAQYYFGKHQNNDDLAYLTCSTGMGAGIIQDGVPLLEVQGNSLVIRVCRLNTLAHF